MADLTPMQTPKPPYLLKDRHGTVTLVLAKPTGVSGNGPFGIKMACGFCDITDSVSVGTWAQKHCTGNKRDCFSNRLTKELTATNLQQFSAGEHDGYEYIPITNIQGWQPCVGPPVSAPAVAAAAAAVIQAAAAPTAAAAAVPAAAVPLVTGQAAAAPPAASATAASMATSHDNSGEEESDEVPAPPAASVTAASMATGRNDIGEEESVEESVDKDEQSDAEYEEPDADDASSEDDSDSESGENNRKRKAKKGPTNRKFKLKMKVPKSGDTGCPNPEVIKKWVKEQKDWTSKRATKADYLEYSQQILPGVTVGANYGKKKVMKHVLEGYAAMFGTKEAFPNIKGYAKCNHD